MQDCSYFLQGLCSNENCPYRHVNVNPNSSVCEGFLRGYCSDGNECRKKHTYVCPDFEATGNCPQGSKCKLHHPKNKRKGIRREGALACNEKKNDRGRYFGSPHIDISECIRAVSEDKSSDEDFFFKEGRFVDFISLDANVEEQQIIDQSSVERYEEGGPLHLQIATAAADFDELIKPIRLIIRNRTTVDSSSMGTGSQSEMSTSYDVSEESHSHCCKNEAL
nr:zinc finger CCCH domain-containing protein 7 [Ipomoea batatas]